MAKSKPKFDAAASITNELIKIIDRGVLPWRKPWADEAKSPADQFALFRALDAGEKARLVTSHFADESLKRRIRGVLSRNAGMAYSKAATLRAQ